MRHRSAAASRRLLLAASGAIDPEWDKRARTGALPRTDLTEIAHQLRADRLDFLEIGARAQESRTWAAAFAVGKRLNLWSQMIVLQAWARAPKYGAIYATSEDVGIPLAILLRLTRRRVRLIVRVEQPVYGRTAWRRRLYTSQVRAGLPRIDHVLCRTVAHRDRMRAMDHGDPTRIRTIEQEVDPQYYDVAAPVVQDAAGVVPTRPYVMSAGLEMRDYSTLLAAVDGLDLALVVGAASPWSRFTFGEHVLPANATIAKFSTPEMRELYRNAVAVVLAVRPTDRACGMNVVAEAWAMQRPVVAATSGLRDTLTAAGNIVVAPGDVDALRAAIVDLVGDPDRAAALGAGGRRYVDEHLSVDAFVALIGDLAGVDPEPVADAHEASAPRPS